MMTQGEKQQLLADTLVWVNRVRAEQGLEALRALRRGIRTELSDCPIARSLVDHGCVEVEPGDGYYEFFGDDTTRCLPSCACDLAEAFDDGEIPELDARRLA